MANNTISQVEINGTTYDLLDANTLSALDSLKTRVTTLESSVGKVSSRYINTNRHTVAAYGYVEETITLTGYGKAPTAIGMTGDNCVTQVMSLTATSVKLRMWNFNNTSKSCQGSVCIIPSV